MTRNRQRFKTLRALLALRDIDPECFYFTTWPRGNRFRGRFRRRPHNEPALHVAVDGTHWHLYMGAEFVREHL